MTASWPGNVRQLVNVIEQCVALTSSPVISDALVEQALEGENTALPTFVEARNQFELNYLRKLLQNHQRQRHPRGENGGAQPDRIL
ncbi:Quorum-sensing regulator protein F [Streptococcus pneumoniae]|nr:Quorum-sensing regulator protein F [Streptococcus pneumoniae]